MEHPRGRETAACLTQMRAIAAEHRSLLESAESVLTNRRCRGRPHLAMEVWQLLEAYVGRMEEGNRLLAGSSCQRTQTHVHERGLLRDYVANINRFLRTWRLDPDFVWVSACLLVNWLRSHARRLDQIIEATAHERRASQPPAATAAAPSSAAA